MSAATPAAKIRAALQPCADDGRLARLGKLAALSLIDQGRAVTRTTLAASSKTVDTNLTRAKRGFSEASLRTNTDLRRIYETARTHQATKPLRRRGRVGAHIMRLRKGAIASALVVARIATAEREDEHARALARLGETYDSASIDRVRHERAGLAVNQCGPAAPVRSRAADLRTEIAATNAAAVQRARDAAGRRGKRATAQSIAVACGLHVGTVERMASRQAVAKVNAATFDFDVPLPPALLRYLKWDLGRALQVERDYIRALHSATMAIAAIVIDRELRLRQEFVRASR